MNPKPPIQPVKVQTGTYPATEPICRATPLTSGPPGSERRRGQRVILRVRASIHMALKGQRESFDVATLSVNPHGAMVLTDRNLAADTRLVLEHAATKERVACRVVRSSQKMPEGFHVPLEFDSAATDFWKIDFPSPDWRPDII
jgi:hypothetical protein